MGRKLSKCSFDENSSLKQRNQDWIILFLDGVSSPETEEFVAVRLSKLILKTFVCENCFQESENTSHKLMFGVKVL